MSRPRLVFATHNRGKLEELRALVAEMDLELVTLDDAGFRHEVVEDRDTFRGNAEKKAEEVAAATGLPAIADDSGLEVDALGGAPGVRSARFAEEVHATLGDAPSKHAIDGANNRKLLDALASVQAPRTARFRCVLALALPDGRGGATVIDVEDGTCEGEILDEPRGDRGFGYDPLFLVPPLGKTLAQLPLDEKNRISHRAQALRKLAARLPSLLTRA